MKASTSFEIGDFYLYERDNPLEQTRYFLGLVTQNGLSGSFKQPRFLILASSKESNMNGGHHLATKTPIELQERMIVELKENRTHTPGSYQFPKTDFLLQTHRPDFFYTPDSLHTETYPYVLYLSPQFLESVKTRKHLESILSDYFPLMPEKQYASTLRFFSAFHMFFESSIAPISLL